MANGEVFKQIYEIVKQIPKGKVATYGQIAKLLNMHKSARIVGYALHSNPEPITIPCHRVVNRFGELSGGFAFGGKEIQAELLKSEGVEIVENRVDLKKHLWIP